VSTARAGPYRKALAREQEIKGVPAIEGMPAEVVPADSGPFPARGLAGELRDGGGVSGVGHAAGLVQALVSQARYHGQRALPLLQLGEADAGLLNDSLQSADRLDLGASLERTIQRPATANCTASRSSSGLGPTTPLPSFPRTDARRSVAGIPGREGLAPLAPQRATTINFRPSPLNSPKATGVAESPELVGRSERKAAFCQRPMCQTQNLKQHWRT
jgi:hypothetical protein